MELDQNNFEEIAKLVFAYSGIYLNQNKKNLTQSRLFPRLRFYKMNSFEKYVELVKRDKDERKKMINLITTNQTFFFREMKHFDYLQKQIIPNHPYKLKFRLWSAAASKGAEAYSAAMILDSYMSRNDWEVVATDINHEVIAKAKRGLYPMKWISSIPDEFKKKYCLKGKNKYEGKFLIDRALQYNNMDFKVANLLDKNLDVGLFDVIFLRNVLYYFNDETQQYVVDNVLKHLKIGGYFIISHTENLNFIKTPSLQQVAPSIYQKSVL
jgi:chemotaxis protein methyltransferase CheR